MIIIRTYYQPMKKIVILSLLNYIIVTLMFHKRQYVTKVKCTQKHLFSIIFLTNEFV